MDNLEQARLASRALKEAESAAQAWIDHVENCPLCEHVNPTTVLCCPIGRSMEDEYQMIHEIVEPYVVEYKLNTGRITAGAA